MNIETGSYVEASDFQEALAKLRATEPETREEDIVMLHASRDQVERLSQTIKAAERKMAIPKPQGPRGRRP
ncbi:MAG: hypothetical protein ACRDJ9_30490 [Dehalococcoidia bacterium]